MQTRNLKLFMGFSAVLMAIFWVKRLGEDNSPPRLPKGARLPQDELRPDPVDQASRDSFPASDAPALR